MKIGISAHGFINPDNGPDSPDGGRFARAFWVQKLITEGHEVYWLQEDRDKGDFGIHQEWASKIQFKCPEKLDVIIFEFRWPIAGRNCQETSIEEIRAGKYEIKEEMFPQEDLYNQWRIIHKYGRQGTKLIIWDKDNKFGAEDEEALSKYDYKVCYPAFHIDKLYKKDAVQLFVPMDFEALQFNVLKRNPGYAGIYGNWNRNIKCGYIGSDYDRDSQFNKYIIPVAQTFPGSVELIGNWKKKSEAQSKAQVTFQYPIPFHGIDFQPRLSYSEAEKKSKDFGTTILLSKDDYAEAGFVASRWVEAIWNNIPAFLPEEFKADSNGFPFDSGNAGDFISYIEHTTSGILYRKNAINFQRNTFINMYREITMNLNVWYEKILELSK